MSFWDNEYRATEHSAHSIASEHYGVVYRVEDKHGALCEVHFNGCDDALTVRAIRGGELSFNGADPWRFIALLGELSQKARKRLDAL